MLKIFFVISTCCAALGAAAQDKPASAKTAGEHKTAVSAKPEKDVVAETIAERFITRHGAAYGLYIASDGSWMMYDETGGKTKIIFLSRDARGRIAEVLENIPADGENAYMAALLQKKLAEAGLGGDAALKKELFESAPRGISIFPDKRRLLMEILAAPNGAITAKIKERMTGMSKKPAPAAKPSAERGFDWDAFARNLSTGNPAAVSQFFRLKDGVNTAKLAVSAAKDLKRDLLLAGDITPQSATAAIAEAGLDGKLLSDNGARLARAVGSTLYFDVPLEKAAVLGRALSAAGFSARPLALSGENSFNLKPGGPQ
ncbi:MAG: hypothetical protein PHP45_09295 [Elusimicrobiales bacterium]|nr:hypothetical protein [Elusimicrobiales bacterium]